jgi:hypothetical protein
LPAAKSALEDMSEGKVRCCSFLKLNTIAVTRLLARVLKEGVQFWYNDTSTVKRGEGGFEKTFLWKTFEVYVTSCQYLFLHVSICSKLVRNFSNTLGFVSLCRYMLLYLTMTFSFSHAGTPSNCSNCLMYNNNEN